MLTAGVDVQKDMLYWSIRAWGPYLTSQNILHGKAFRFDEIEAVMNAEYFKANGDQMLVELCLIDSGYNADTTYEFCLLNSDWAKPVKGSSWGMMSNFRISRIDSVKGQNIGIDLVMVDGGKYKDTISARLRKPNGRGSWMVHKDCDIEYAKQVTAEQKVNKRMASGAVKQVWELKQTHGDNHWLDCEVYAFAAADIMGVRTLHLQEGQQVAEQVRQAKSANDQYTPEESWIQTNENWI
jgi:phage terminase large subunit GpA-like protein